MRFIIGDLLTGRRIQNVPALSGSWSEVLNRPGDLSCTVTLKDPAIQRLGLANSATPWKAFLAAIEGDTVLQAGPIGAHDYDGQASRLTLTASGMWEYFNRRVLLPYPTDDPTDPTADTNLVKSLQGIVRFYAEQAMSWPSGDVPVILPDEIAGSNERNEAGANLASVGRRMAEITDVENGPDVRFEPRLTSDRLGVEWVLLIGSPTQPALYSPQDVVFNVGVPGSSVSNLRVKVDGSRLASRGYATGGRGSDTVLMAVSDDPTLTNAGFPIVDLVDSTHSTVVLQETLDGYAAEITQRGRYPIISLSFDHDTAQRPFVGAFRVGDFASVRVKGDPYLADGTVRMRITARSGDLVSRKVRIELQPEVD